MRHEKSNKKGLYEGRGGKGDEKGGKGRGGRSVRGFCYREGEPTQQSFKILNILGTIWGG